MPSEDLPLIVGDPMHALSKQSHHPTLRNLDVSGRKIQWLALDSHAILVDN